MFVVDPTRGRSQGFALVAAASVLALGACTDPVQNTDLRPAGPPDVLTVLVLNDATGQVVEQATYCKVGDEKRPARVGLPGNVAADVCPADLTKGAEEITNAYPDGWYVRIVFDELLDPSVEDLTEVVDDDGVGTDVFEGSIANTHPVKLECESIGGGFVEVDYDGYYSPSGNNITWPIGPSLVIKPLEPRSIATGKSCRVTINDNVTDKDGNKVPDADRAPGRFTFKVAPIQVIALDPADDPMGTSPIDPFVIYTNGDNVYVQFNTAVDSASFCDDGPLMDQCEWQFSPQVGECSTPRANGSLVACDPAKNGMGCPTGDTCDYAGDDLFPLSLIGLTEAEYAFYTNAAIEGGKPYTFSIKQGAKLKDRCGVETTFGAPSVDDLTLTHYTTKAFGLKSTTPATGDLVSGMKKPQLIFNNVIDPASLDATQYTLTPQPLAFAQTSSTDGDIFFAGHYALDTTYTLTIKAGAKVRDYYGAEYTFAEQKVITWKTQPAVTVSTSPADLATLTKAAATSLSGVTFTFNEAMDATTLTAGVDYTFVNSAGATIPTSTAVGAAPNGCSATSTGCQLRVRGTAPLPAGDYTFTFKAGAQISAVTGITATYTQAADKVIHFTVKDPAPVTPPIQCL